MNEFETWYIALLRKQVEEEIAFLIKNGHDHDRIYRKCIFCHNTSKGWFNCNRIKELRRFLESIKSHENCGFTVQRNRRAIGFEVAPNHVDIIPDKFDLGVKQLPLLSVKL